MRDEAGNAAPLLDEIAAVMSAVGSFEMIAVNDGSIDGTAAELTAARARHATLRVVSLAKPCGQSQALIAGALAARGAFLITLDGDGQNAPADIPRLLAVHDANVLAIGHRQQRADSALRQKASLVAALARRILLADATPDAGCGLKVMEREMFLSLPRFDALHRFIPVLAARAGCRIVSVAVSHRPRLHGRSKYGVFRRGLIGIVDLLGVMWLIHRHTRPRLS